MIYLITALSVSAVLWIWSASTTCSLATFASTVALRSQLTGPDAYPQLVESLLTLPGVRLIERGDRDVLMSVLPTITSMNRGWGVFLAARYTEDGVMLLARRRIPLPGADPGSTLRQLEREARMSARRAA